MRAFPDTGGKWPISMDGGVVPIWSPTKPEFFYRTDDQRIMVVPYRQTADAFSIEQPRSWSNVSLASLPQRNLDIAPDGNRFLVLISPNSPEADTRRNHIVYLENFGNELRGRLATGQ